MFVFVKRLYIPILEHPVISPWRWLAAVAIPILFIFWGLLKKSLDVSGAIFGNETLPQFYNVRKYKVKHINSGQCEEINILQLLRHQINLSHRELARITTKMEFFLTRASHKLIHNYERK